jgi:plastocyanin domain-containing protein
LRFHFIKASSEADSPWLLVIEIALVAAILFYLYFRKRQDSSPERGIPQKIEIKLTDGCLSPAEIHLQLNRPIQLLIHRHDRSPDDELFEIEELGIYELLPALHTTIIFTNPQKSGKFKMVLGAEREAGVVVVE